jgi:RNA recognition motif-containing protein
MPQSVLLVLEGLPSTFTSEELTALCLPCGHVTFAKVIRHSTEPLAEHLGFVRMETVEQGQQLVEELHGKQIGTHTLSVMVVPDQPS